MTWDGVENSKRSMVRAFMGRDMDTGMDVGMGRDRYGWDWRSFW